MENGELGQNSFTVTDGGQSPISISDDWEDGIDINEFWMKLRGNFADAGEGCNK